MTDIRKPIIGFTCGDLNGIGIELIIKSLADARILDFIVPVIFANNKCINFYRKSLPEYTLHFSPTPDLSKLNLKQINLVNCWEEEVVITPGELTAAGGKYALVSLEAAVTALKNKQIDGIVTAPIHKKNIQSPEFNFSGHTPYLQSKFGNTENLMLLVAENLRMALVTEHITIQEVGKHITKDKIKQITQTISNANYFVSTIAASFATINQALLVLINELRILLNNLQACDKTVNLPVTKQLQQAIITLENNLAQYTNQLPKPPDKKQIL